VSKGFFSPENMIWRVDRELALLLAGGRALLMQLAHPKVAAGVAEHSHFKDEPLARLHRTMSTMWSIVFDDKSQACTALGGVKNIHKKVRGLIQPTEPLPTGTPYDALDAELLLWVHATLVDSAMLAYELFVKPLTADEKSSYYHDTKRLAYLFEIRETILPVSVTDFSGYMQRMLIGDTITVGQSARLLAQEILMPRSWILKPAAPIFHLITAGLLPQRLREGYGLNWGRRKEKTFWRLAKTVRILRPLVPAPLRIVPNARRAEKAMLRRDKNCPKF
jgi:uncharacterized protein (DUF2236 family)